MFPKNWEVSSLAQCSTFSFVHELEGDDSVSHTKVCSLGCVVMKVGSAGSRVPDQTDAAISMYSEDFTVALGDDCSGGNR